MSRLGTKIVFLANVKVSDNVRNTDHGKRNVGHVVTLSDRDTSVISERVFLRTEDKVEAMVKAIHSVFGMEVAGKLQFSTVGDENMTVTL